MRMLGILSAVMGALLAGAAAPVRADVKPTPAEWAGMREYWRHAPRYGCLACSVYIPAPKAAVVPRSIGSCPVLEGRRYDLKARLACFCAEGQWLWAADDTCVYQIDARKRAAVRTFTVLDGLPDVPVRQLLADGPCLWIVGAGRLARLAIAGGTIDVPPQPAFSVARMAAGPAGTFLVTDRGAYQWSASAKGFQPLGSYPGQDRVAKAVTRGFWQAQWRRHWSSLLRAAAVGRRELYVLAGNTLSRYNASDGWRKLGGGAWRVVLDEPYLWALITGGLVQYDERTAQVRKFTGGAGPAPGLPIDLVSAGGAVYLLVEPRFEPRAKRFVGGGICRLDPRTGDWSTTRRIGQTDVSFTTAADVSDDQVLVAVRLAGAVEHRSLHPGMARVRQHLPRITGLAIAVRPPSEPWQAIRLEGLDGESRWVMGQGKSHRRDRVRPQRIPQLCVCGQRLWAVTHNFPDKYYAGYYSTVRCVARRTEDGWMAVADRARTRSLDLAGEQPTLMCLTATHRQPIVLAHGHRRMLGLVCLGGTLWVVHEGGIYAHRAASDRFTAVLAEKFRAYWQLTSGACDAGRIWLGSDCGTVTCLEPRSGQFQLLGVAPARKITHMHAQGRTVWVKTARARVHLPAALAGLAKLPAAETLRYDGRVWSASPDGPPPQSAALRYGFENGNYLLGPGPKLGRRTRLGFLKGVFQPKALCAEDTKALWVKVWGGVERISLGSSAPSPRQPAGGRREQERPSPGRRLGK